MGSRKALSARSQALRIAGLALLIIATGAAASCSVPTETEPESYALPAYQADSMLLTANAGSDLGVATGAAQLTTRVNPGVFTEVPNGQLIANADLAATQVLPGPYRQVVYTINPAAVWSDGVPVTCMDFELTYLAGAHPSLFGSEMPLMSEVERIDCHPTSQRFTVIFHPGQGARWRHLFAAGEVLPAHAIAAEAGMSREALVDALAEGPGETVLESIAPVWHDAFDLHPTGTGAAAGALSVSRGPYRISRVGEEGEVTLEANPSYWGGTPGLTRLVVWPKNANTEQLAARGHLIAADTTGADRSWLNHGHGSAALTEQAELGWLVDSLRLSDTPASGVASREARHALAACVDRVSLVEAVAHRDDSLPDAIATSVHVLPPQDARFTRLNDVGSGMAPAPPAGMTVRVGYSNAADQDAAAVVEALRQSCAHHGIIVEDASAAAHSSFSLADLASRGENPPTIDAFLQGIDPYWAYPAGGATDSLEELEASERNEWEELNAIPLLSRPRTYVVDREVGSVVVCPGRTGTGWNMDRWQESEG